MVHISCRASFFPSNIHTPPTRQSVSVQVSFKVPSSENMAVTKKATDTHQDASRTPKTPAQNTKNPAQRAKAKGKVVAAARAAANNENTRPLASPAALARGVAAAHALANADVNVVPNGMQGHIDAALATQKGSNNISVPIVSQRNH